MKEKTKIGILSLGCPRNLVDSESILGRLGDKGYQVVDIDKADVAIVNTCAFITDAKEESIDAILELAELKKEGRLKKIIVYGCLAQRYKKELVRELPEIDAFVGSIGLNHEKRRFPITPEHFVYLKICEGCVNNCSFCIIPKIKGKFTSLDKEAVLEKVRQFNKEKKSELNIVGQDISGYGIDLYKKPVLAGLLKDIVRNSSNIGWIRLLYLNPARISEDLIKVINDSVNVCKYIDMPVQHINNRVLKLMKRSTNKSDIIKAIEKIRKNISGVSLRTSLIVGFPSETDKEFQELFDFVKDARFERLGVFTYSREEGTAAYSMKAQLPEKLKQERFNSLMQLQQDISKEINTKLLGNTLKVLIDGQENGCYLGRTQGDAPEVDGTVYVSSSRKLVPGDFVNVKITDTMEYDLTGKVVS
ncbi:MAG: MiaB/RimO family radical SAM methylthiotransferase [Candidatus Omnitrophica bacterium]|nr:MiaB/RimO family radical SAM methylthiotransferase [Candidatus Omnitrophota bacterium]